VAVGEEEVTREMARAEKKGNGGTGAGREGVKSQGDEEEATSPAAPEDSTERELLRQKMAQKRAGSTITPIVGEESKIESGKRTKKENERTSQNASTAPPPQGRLALRQLNAFLSAADQAAWRNCPHSGWSCPTQQCWHCNAGQ
jgi:hypothetical protein